MHWQAELTDALDRLKTLLADALDRDQLGAPVPACPDWTISDCYRHLGGIQRWAVGAIREGHGRTSSTAPQEAAAFLEWFRAGSDALLAALPGDPSTAVWTFHPNGTLGFWQRRQVHENVVHRVDVEQALDLPFEVSTDVAVDGIGEVLDVFVPRRLRQGRLDPLPHTVTLVADEGGSWVFGDPEEEPVATLRGPAAVLYLHLWKRLPPDHPDLRWEGGATAGRAVLAMPLTS